MKIKTVEATFCVGEESVRWRLEMEDADASEVLRWLPQLQVALAIKDESVKFDLYSGERTAA